MARQLNVNLVFSANTAGAQANIQKLQTSLTQLTTQMTAGKTPLGLTQELANANTQVASLKANLAQAMNTSTGKLDLTKFNAGLKASGMQLSDYRKTLTALGPEGQRAFQGLTQAIVQGQMPLQKTSGLLGSMMDTLANTAKWMIASSALRVISQGFQEAFRYAEDLNKSLTSIRIVTNKSMEEMKEFANYANKAAKALSATTTAYTDAALIYYQQGLEGEEVYKRAEATLKLANVTRESAEQVSQWMTAIWNNFDDGTETLEYYADVITALGAATASSSKEIADGLEKFAAVADTVGLSYEYATTALATITSETRQSADVVGTALKTLFARIQGLKLGETLDDGTTLNKYSQALMAVGINIKNANGELKDMDLILNEMGAKWDTLGKAEQVALAQSVAGIRQYTQLIALMDNWDTFKVNLEVAETSEGALEQQQEVWAESWEAAQKRVKTSGEALYNELINDQFFIDMNNVFAELIETITEMVKAMGGLKTLLPMLAGLMLKAFGPTVLTAMTNLKHGFDNTRLAAQNTANEMRATALREQGRMAGHDDSQVGAAATSSADRKLKLYQSIEGITRNLSKKEQETLQFYIEQEQELSEILQLQAQIADQANAKLEKVKAAQYDPTAELQQASEQTRMHATKLARFGRTKENSDFVKAQMQQANIAIKSAGMAQDNINQFTESDFKDVDSAKQAANNLLQNTHVQNNLDAGSQKALQSFSMNKSATQADVQAIQELLGKLDLVSTKSDEVKGKMQEAFKTKGIKRASADIEGYVGGLDKLQKSSNKAKSSTRAITEAKQQATAANNAYTNSEKQADAATERFINNAKAMSKVPMSQTIMGMASGFGMLMGGISGVTNGINSMIQMFKEGEHTFTGWVGAISSVAMSVSMTVMGLQSLGSALGITAATTAVATAIEKGYTDEKRRQLAVQALGITLTEGETASESKRASVQLGAAAADAIANGHKRKGILLSLSAKAAHLLEAVGLGALIPVKYADAVASGTAGAATMAMIWPIGLLALAIGALIATIIILVAAFKSISNAYNADAIAAKKAKENAKALADTYSEVKDKYEELKNSLADYQESQNAINKLREGTLEWKQAIQEANAQVIDLLNKYPELMAYMETLDGGRMVIKDAGWEMLLQQQAQQVSLAQNMSSAAALAARKAETKAEQTELVRNSLSFNDGTIMVGGVLGGLLTAGGTSVGAGMLKGYDLAIEYRATSLIDNLTEKYGELGEKALLNLDNSLKDLGVTEQETVDKTRELIRQRALLNQQEKLLIENSINSILSSRLGFNADIYTKGLQKLIGDKAYKEVEEKFGNVNATDIDTNWYGAAYDILSLGMGTIRHIRNKDGSGIHPMAGDNNAYAYDSGWGVYSTELGDQVFEDYMRSQGIEYEDVDFTNDRVKYTIIGEDGETKDAAVTYSSLLDFQKQQYLQQRSYEYEKIIKKLSNSVSFGQSSQASVEDKVFASYIQNGDLSQLSPEVYAEVLKKGAMKYTDLWDKYGEELSQLGITSVEQLATEFENQFQNWDYDTLMANEHQRKKEEAQATIESGAAQLEIEEEALEVYTELLQQNNAELKDNIDKAAEMAVQHFTVAKGVNKLREAFDTHKDTLRSAEQNSLEYAEALGEIKQAAEEIFGMELSAGFVQSNIDEMQKMLAGDIEAYERLKEAALEDWAIHLSLSDSEQKELLDDLLRLKDKAENSLEITLDINDKEFMNKLNTMLQEGKVTEQELEAVFRNANLEWAEGSTFSYYDLPQSTTTESHITGSGPGGEYDLTMSTTNTSTTRLPWIGDNPPEFKSFGSSSDINNFVSSLSSDNSDVFVDQDTGEEISAAQLKNGEKSLNVGTVYKTKGTGDQTNSNEWYLQGVKSTIDSDVLKYDEEANESGASKKKRLQELENERDRYHEINEIIEDTKNELDSLSEAKEQAYGKSKIALMDQEIKKQQEIIEQNKKLQTQQKEYLQKDKQNLFEVVSANGLQLEFDDHNRISNYEELEDYYIEKLKKTSSETEREKIQEEFELFTEAASNYEDTLNDLEEQASNLQEESNNLSNLQLEKIQYAAEMVIELENDDNKYLEYLLESIEDKSFSAAEKIEYLGQMTNNTEQQLSAQKQAVAEIMSLVEEQGYITEEQTNALREGRDAILEYTKSLEELRDQMDEALNADYDQWIEDTDKELGILEHLIDTATNYKNIIELTGKKNLGINNQLLKEIDTATLQTSKALLASSKQRMEDNLQLLTQYEAAYAQAITEEDKKYWQEKIDYAQEQDREFQNEYLENWNNTQEIVKQNFINSIHYILEEYEAAIAETYGNLEYLQQAFERQSEVNDRYLSDYEKVYQINKLNRQLNNAIDNTDNIGAQKELILLQQELLTLKEQEGSISQKDVEMLQKKYELMLAEQAFKEAQNAKNQVTLQRDSQGNYNYVYTASQNNIDQTQQAYEDSLNAIAKFGEEGLQEMEEQILQTQKNFSTALEEVNSDETLSFEQRTTKIQEITKYYTDLLKYYTDEAQKIMLNNQQLNEKYNLNLADNFQGTYLGVLMPTINSFEELYTKVSEEMIAASKEMEQANNDYEENTKDVCKTAGSNYSDFSETVTKEMNNIVIETEETSSTIATLGSQFVSTANQVVAKMISLQNLYDLSALRDENYKTATSINDLIKAYAHLENVAQEKLDPEQFLKDSEVTTQHQLELVPKSTSQTVDETYNKRVTWVSDNHNYAEVDGKLYNAYSLFGKMGQASLSIGDAVMIPEGTQVLNTTKNNFGEGYQNASSINLVQSEEFTKNKDSVKINPGIYGSSTTLGSLSFSKRSINDPVLQKGYYLGMLKPFDILSMSNFVGGTVNFDLKTNRVKIGWNNQFKNRYSSRIIENPNGGDPLTLTQYVGDGITMNIEDYNKLINHLGWTNFSFDTGGYTGSWGPEGRMAMLHQKEIVLNAHDTENLLTVVGIVRSMVDQLEANTKLASYGLGQLTARTIGVSSDTLQQEVTIHAEFPNATDHNEIEEAFRNLTNLASQYANRK